MLGQSLMLVSLMCRKNTTSAIRNRLPACFRRIAEAYAESV